jgi:hypothetical protein
MNAHATRPFLIGWCAIALALTAMAEPAAPSRDIAAYERALYPAGMPMRQNEITDAGERAEFVFAAEAGLPDTHRHVVVYAERLSRDLPFDKIHSVFVAVVERHDDTLRVMDRRNVTEEIGVFTEFPGNFLELHALVTPVSARNRTIAAVELLATLDGTGSITEATHLFYAISEGGKLAPILDLDTTYASGRSGGLRSARIATLAIVPNANGVGDVLVRSRALTWTSEDDESTPPECGPVSITRYRFDGTKFEQASTEGDIPAGAFVLPRLEVEETDTCGNSLPPTTAAARQTAGRSRARRSTGR